MSPTCRTFLAELGATTMLGSLAGCTSLQPPGTGQDKASTRTTSSVDDPTAVATPGRSNPQVGPTCVDASLTRQAYLLRSWPLAPGRRPLSDATPVSSLSAAGREAVTTAIGAGRYTTDEPARALLEDLDGLGLVAHRDRYYTVSHTLTTYVLNLDMDVEPASVPEGAATVGPFDDAVRDHPSVADAVDVITPLGTENPSSEYRTLVLTSALAAFIETYDYIDAPSGLGRIDYAFERHFPPYTVTAERADDEELYGRPVLDAGDFSARSRALMRRTLTSDRRTPLHLEPREQRGVYRAATVPLELEAHFDRGSYVRLDGDVVGLAVAHTHWDRQPFELEVRTPATERDADEPPAIEFSVTNTASVDAILTVPGLLPFGLLWAAPLDRSGPSVQLWHPAFETSDLVTVEDGVAVPDSYQHDRLVAPGETLTRTYRLGRDVDDASPGRYAIGGSLWAKWPSHEGESRYDWNSAIYPFEVVLDCRTSTG